MSELLQLTWENFEITYAELLDLFDTIVIVWTKELLRVRGRVHSDVLHKVEARWRGEAGGEVDFELSV